MHFLQVRLALAAFLTLCLAPSRSPAQDQWTVLPAEDGAYTDRSIILLKHFQRLSQESSWNRQVELTRVTDQKSWEAYRSSVLARYRQALGLPFPERTPLMAETLRTLDRGDYRIEVMTYQAVPDVYVSANLYVPQTGQPPYPGILFPCGHSPNGKAVETYHSAALGLVKKGYVVLLYDPPGQGERYQYLDDKGLPLLSDPVYEHTLLANQMFLIGRHLMAFLIWEGIRGIDYLISRPEVDSTRIGCTGNSGGGTVTLHLTPLEERIKVAVPVGTVGASDMELGSGGIGDGEQNLPGLVSRWITSADLMLLAWPAPYRLIKEARGGVITGTRESFVQAEYLYRTLGSPEKMSLVETEWPHGYFRAMREPMYQWFGRWFKGIEDDSREPDLKIESEKDLLCSRTGQMLNEKGRAVWDWTAGQFCRNFPARAVPRSKTTFAAFRDSLRAEAGELLQNPVNSGVLRVDTLGSFTAGGGIGVEKLALYTEPYIYLPALFFHSASSGRAPVVLLTDSRGKCSDNGALALTLAGQGVAVLALDLRGCGETEVTRKSEWDTDSPYASQTLGTQAAIAYDGLKLGRSVFAMRVFDIQAALRWVRSRREVDPERVALVGRGSCGMNALYAAALDGSLRGVLADSALSTFARLATCRLYNWNFIDFLPRVLTCHDLPQVAAAARPGRVTLLNSLDENRRVLQDESARADYAWTVECFRALGEGGNFRVESYASLQQRLGGSLRWALETLK
jgi:cephalosporin-C deacetylase-like acetyl esterase